MHHKRHVGFFCSSHLLRTVTVTQRWPVLPKRRHRPQSGSNRLKTTYKRAISRIRRRLKTRIECIDISRQAKLTAQRTCSKEGVSYPESTPPHIYPRITPLTTPAMIRVYTRSCGQSPIILVISQTRSGGIPIPGRKAT